VHAETIPVVAVIDGDTIVVRSSDGSQREIDLREVDAPEIGQPYGEEAKKTLSNLLENQMNVTLQNSITGPDLREKANVIIGNKDAAMTMLWQGAAWAESRSFNSNHLGIEKQAKKNKRGLWERENPTPPWDWRKHNGVVNTNDLNFGPLVQASNIREAEERALRAELQLRKIEAIERMKIEDPVGYARWREEKKFHRETINVQQQILNELRFK
jgi:endonuclease YncB( thermonuclease family)